MRLAETVTFGGGGLDRSAALRGDTDALAAILAGPRARVLPLWRGRPLLAGGSLCAVLPDHPALNDSAPMVFLGRSGKDFWFAADLVRWAPDPDQPRPTDSLFDQTEQGHPLMPEESRFAELRAVMAQLGGAEAELAATAKAVTGWHDSHGFCANCGAATLATHAGWQRSCPACGRSHFPRTDPVVIMLVTRGNSVLLGRSPGWPDGMFSLLAGFMEPGETIEAAVRREVSEEAGISVGRVEYLACQPWPYPSSLMIGCRGEALSDSITLDPVELEAARWVTREEVALALTGGHPEIRAPRRGAIAGFLLANWVADRLD